MDSLVALAVVSADLPDHCLLLFQSGHEPALLALQWLSLRGGAARPHRTIPRRQRGWRRLARRDAAIHEIGVIETAILHVAGNPVTTVVSGSGITGRGAGDLVHLRFLDAEPRISGFSHEQKRHCLPRGPADSASASSAR